MVFDTYYSDGIGNRFLNKTSKNRLAANRVMLCAMSIFAIENNRDFIKLALDDGSLILPELNDMLIRSGYAAMVR